MPPVHYHEGAFPPDTFDWPELIPLIGPASAAVARYDGMLSAVPNPGLLLAPLTTQEAVLSSRIEGTQATMEEVLEFEAGQTAVSPERRDDIQEVLNYTAAMRVAEEMLVDLPLSLRVVREAHRVLLSGVRGQNKSPGEYRRVSNWIGPPGCSIDRATYVPIAADRLQDAMGRWERFIHSDHPDRLVQLALLHAEFEALHPFLDGNGRLGRMMIPLFMWQVGLIHRPMFYISDYFESRRSVYYERLLAVSRDGDWTGWTRFFLRAVKAQAEDNLVRVRAVLSLYEGMKPRVADITHSHYAIHALDWLFERPVFKSTDFATGVGVPATTAKRLLAALREEGVLTMVSAGHGRHPAVFAYPELLRVAGSRAAAHVDHT